MIARTQREIVLQFILQFTLNHFKKIYIHRVSFRSFYIKKKKKHKNDRNNLPLFTRGPYLNNEGILAEYGKYNT